MKYITATTAIAAGLGLVAGLLLVWKTDAVYNLSVRLAEATPGWKPSSENITPAAGAV